MSNVVTTSTKLVNDLIALARSKTKYSNKYPYNVLYFDGTIWSADCVNLLKALFNGRDITDKTKGSYQKGLTNTGDCTELGLITQCTDVSTDFSKLGSVPKVLYMAGHIGCYLGKEIKENGITYNVVEATTNFGGGIVFSYVDENGFRYNYKGGKKSKCWEKHGEATKWVKYEKVSSTTNPNPKPTKEIYRIRKSWDDEKSQIGAYENLEYAKADCKQGYSVFDSKGKCVYFNPLKVACPYGEPKTTLYRGCAKGPDVKWLQWHLVKTGFLSSEFDGKTNIDGSFGARTEQALMKFQTKYPECGNSKGQPDGRCGAKSRAKLKSLVK